MREVKYLIIGGGIAGTTAAETIRANDKDGSIAIISDEPYPLYSRVMLSKPFFLLEEKSGPSIWLKTKDWYENNRIKFIGGDAAVSLDVAQKKVVTAGGVELGYEKLLIAAGAHSRIWNVKGADKKGVCYLRTLDEAREFASAMKGKKHALVIGSGNVAFEAIEILRSKGIDVTEVMLEKYFWEPMLDEEGGKIVEKALLDNRVEIHRRAEVAEVLGGESVDGVVLRDGKKIECDLILCGIGVTYPVDWIKAAGGKTNHGVLANEFLESSVPETWVAGDIAEFSDTALHEQHQAGNWMNAREQGRIAGLNMTASFDKFKTGKQQLKLVSFCTSRAFGIDVTFGGDFRLSPGRTDIKRGLPQSGSHTRLVIQDNRIIGAALVNRVKEMGAIVKLIGSNFDVSHYLGKLSDPEFDLKTLLSN